VGSISGAIPPVIGYVGVKGSLDLAALILFVMIVLWQMPHFFAIASFRLKEYAAASIPILPLKKGMYQTKIQMVLYILAFIPVSVLLFFYGYTGYVYLVLTLFLGGSWLILGLQGFKCGNDFVWARKMFGLSLVVVMGISFSILLLCIPQ
jgi:protoheme IX farnesyltransferase